MSADVTEIVISGSMKSNPEAIDYAERLVKWASENNIKINVGDNPKGIDAAVIEMSGKLQYDKVTVWYVGNNPRCFNKYCSLHHAKHALVQNPHQAFNDLSYAYTMRDRFMLASIKDISTAKAYFISNGDTHYHNGNLTGTQAAYLYAKELGIRHERRVFPLG